MLHFSTVVGLLIITLFLVRKLNKRLKVIPLVFMELLRESFYVAIAIMTAGFAIMDAILCMGRIIWEVWSGCGCLLLAVVVGGWFILRLFYAVAYVGRGDQVGCHLDKAQSNLFEKDNRRVAVV